MVPTRGISEAGSRGPLAEFKADIINDYIADHSIKSTVEFGCGDGINLEMINYTNYLGFDVSKSIIATCSEKFKNDKTKSFMLYDPSYFVNNTMKQADLLVCLDVLYHVINEKDYQKLLDDIFSFASPHVILYTTLENDGSPQTSPKILHRNVLSYLKKYSDYTMEIVKQKHTDLTKADFIILTKKV